jgi:tRNA(Ile)-lysidine synthase TilS/MesJ
MPKELTEYQKIERSIITTYRRELWSPFVLAVKKYALIQAGDKIAVCISGGKDSMLLAKLMQQLHRHSEVPFELVFLVMDPGYNEENRRLIIDNATLMNIPITMFESNIFDVVTDAGGAPCYLCARMRRGCLYSKAKELGCNKIALGHHFDDMIETLLLNMTYASEIKTMLPKLKSTNFEGMELIRPLYKVKEKDIISWSNYNELRFLRCACKFTAESEYNEENSKRKEIKALIKEIKKTNPAADDNLFRSIHNVNLAAIVGYRDKDCGEKHSYLENYKKEELE